MKHKKIGTRFMALGLVLLLAALCLTGFNIWDMRRAAASSDAIMQQLDAVVPQRKPAMEKSALIQAETIEEQGAEQEMEIPDYILVPEMDMPETVMDGIAYIGILEIPDLGLSLPVTSSWNYELLRNSPCRYTGSAYTNDLVIAAHNYAKHFGNLKNLYLDSEIFFTDANGNVFRYLVVELETLEATDIEGMTSDTRGITLFTCTVGGQSRVTVRAERADLA